ncbi:hypothetical protein OROGR_001049 [Orobanche gracilis]
MPRTFPNKDMRLASADHPPESSNSDGEVIDHDKRSVRDLVKENAVVVCSREGCCMRLVVTHLLNGHGVRPTVLDIDEKNEAQVNKELFGFVPTSGGAPPQFPAVFVGGKLFGGPDEIIGAHISGELVPRLKAAGALWL